MRRVAACLAIFLLCLGLETGSAELCLAGSATAKPGMEWKKSALLFSMAGAVGGIGQTIPVSRVSVPPNGLDPERIKWAVDRRAAGHWDKKAQDRSDLFQASALVWPVAAIWTEPRGGAGWTAALPRVLIYAQASALNLGLSHLLKHAVSRPRPFLYHTNREDAVAHWPSPSGDDFQSMPSAHTSASFCAAAFASVDHLLSRPEAGWKEHALVGFVGGFLAGETAALRVRGGFHFPTDVVAGAGLGTLCGAGVPLLHHYAHAPSRAGGKKWLSALGGTVAGAALAVLLAPAIGG